MAAAVTEGQRLRGHGVRGWADAGWNLDARTLNEELARLVLTYGELAQATYDNLGSDRSQPATFGYCRKQPHELLSYLTSQYPLAPGAPEPQPPLEGTGRRYRLPAPCADGLSPIFHARPGKSSGTDPPVAAGKLSVVEAAQDKLFATVTGVLVTLVDGSNGGGRLFGPDPATGRGVQERGAFIGYIAVSEPQGDAGEVDVALVWRGTIFKEEWESNFAEDKLTKWEPDPGFKAGLLEAAGPGGGDNHKAPHPSEVGVHDGFDDLYNRRTPQPVHPSQQAGPLLLSPREACRVWLKRLFQAHNVTSVTSTGHSLGGGLATISAFGVADLLDTCWDDWAQERQDQKWQTQAKPKVSLFSFASPRVGNYTFGQTMRGTGPTPRVAVMRVANKGDVVPLVPGIVVQGLSRLVEAVPVAGKRAAIDSNSWLVQGCQKLYYGVSRATSLLYPDKHGYFHVGQVLLLDTADAPGVIKPGAGKHNLELHLHLVSQLGQPALQRNPLLMNKHGDQWTNNAAPAEWWNAAPPAAHLYRDCTLLQQGGPLAIGRWAPPPAAAVAAAAAPAPAAAPAAAPAGVAAAADG
uniref:Fungal lipase-type domain-containing protein n=1 Tax=Tetradesmus obliquus TaxID=3088 RepID=A0A383WFD7_TETOB|eukprot:jgi/Sobl393_1/7815/SZX76305.1